MRGRWMLFSQAQRQLEAVDAPKEMRRRRGNWERGHKRRETFWKARRFSESGERGGTSWAGTFRKKTVGFAGHSGLGGSGER